jgi:hypothetical protein
MFKIIAEYRVWYPFGCAKVNVVKVVDEIIPSGKEL